MEDVGFFGEEGGGGEMKKENFREKSLKGSICVFLLEYRTDKGYHYGRFCHIQFTRIPKRMV
jgi:hypothetical protein